MDAQEKSLSFLPPIFEDIEQSKRILNTNMGELTKCSVGDLSVYGDNGALKNFEILGREKDVEKIRMLFRNTSAKINVFKESGSNENSKNNTDTENDTSEKKASQLANDFREKFYTQAKRSGGDNDSTLTNDTNLRETKNDIDTSSDSENEKEEPPTCLEGRSSLSASAIGLSPEIQNRRDIIRIQNRITNLGDRNFISPNRWYIKECCWFKKVGKRHSLVFFFFTDLLVISKLTHRRSQSHMDVKSPTKVKFRKALDLHCLDVQAVPDSSKGHNLLRLKSYKTSKKGHKKKWKRIFAADTKEHRDQTFVELCQLRDSLLKLSLLDG